MNGKNSPSYPGCVFDCINFSRMCHICWNNPSYRREVENKNDNPSATNHGVGYYKED